MLRHRHVLALRPVCTPALRLHVSCPISCEITHGARLAHALTPSMHFRQLSRLPTNVIEPAVMLTLSLALMCTPRAKLSLEPLLMNNYNTALIRETPLL